mgnify:CR=1 FL=1
MARYRDAMTGSVKIDGIKGKSGDYDAHDWLIKGGVSAEEMAFRCMDLERKRKAKQNYFRMKNDITR